MSDWTPIERETIDVRGVNRDYPGLLDVDIKLRPWPDEDWCATFEQGPGVSFSLSMHKPKISGGTVSITPPDGELDRYVAHVDQRIEATNNYYRSEVLPRVQAQQERRAAEATERQMRLDEAKRRASEL